MKHVSTKIQQLARQYGQGKATAKQVASAVTLQGFQPATSVEELTRREEDQTDGYSEGPDDWRQIYAVYLNGGMTETQFNALHDAVFGPGT